MISDFASRFGSFYSARCDQRAYLEAKGYRAEGDRSVWEPQDYTDLEPETVNCGPGAMSVGELDDVWENNDEPELMFEEF